MLFSKREKVPPKEIWRNLLDEYQRIWVAIFYEGTQEFSIELACVSGKLSCLAIDQK